MQWPLAGGARSWLMLLVVPVLLAGCANKPNRAPVEERKPPPRSAAPAASAAAVGQASAASAAEAAKPLPGSENAGKPGFYTVKPGDTLTRIALDNGQSWRDLKAWNNLDKPDLIEVGQVLRVAPPDAGGGVIARPVQPAGRVESKPLDAGKPGASNPVAAAAPGAITPSATPATSATPAAPAAATAPAAAGSNGVAAAAASAAPAPAPTASPAAAVGSKPPAREGDDDINWLWPAAGPVATPFDEARSKGVAITGKPGDPVYAAADGRVVYAGSGLRGYGNLVIIKHNATYLTAYAHNQTLLVKDEQPVRRGQKIAEMGSSDADRVQLHFEIRRLGVPIDPLKLLPPR
ncbi:MAG: peptidoglycan DD-metalloendopeptidase family protein [Proteobacteria bacterium]|nr:peptidoglycan DD-metalloendopeptidase family protein [Pseudomonadota bacterium]